MTDEQKQFFSNINKAWELLKPHVKEPESYKKVLNDFYKMFFERNSHKFTDKWWKATIDEFFGYSESYYKKPLYDFVGDLAMGILNFWEHQYKLNDNSYNIPIKASDWG